MAEQRAGGNGAATAIVTSAATATDASVYRVQLHPRPHVRFEADVVDNEHLNRKKSNKCCIFHKRRAFDESSSESGEDDSDGPRKPRAKTCKHKHAKSQRPKKPTPFVPADGQAPART